MASAALGPAARPADRRELAIGLGCALVTVAIWTSFLLLSRHAVKGTLLPYDLAALRFGIAGLVMLPVVLTRGTGGLRARQILLLALTAGPLFSLFSFTAFVLAPASHAATLMPGLLPFWTLLLLWLVTGEPPDRPRQLCLALILAGIFLLLWSTTAEAPAGAWRGDLLCLVPPLSWAVYTVLVRRWQVAALTATATVATGSMLAYLPVYLLFLPKGITATPLPEVALQAVFQGLIAVVVALFTYTRAVSILGPGIVTMLAAAVPAAAALLAVPLLHEPLGLMAGLGIGVVTLGMLATLLGLRRRRPSAAA